MIDKHWSAPPTRHEAAFIGCFLIGIILACVEADSWPLFVATKVVAALFCLGALLLLPMEIEWADEQNDSMASTNPEKGD